MEVFEPPHTGYYNPQLSVPVIPHTIACLHSRYLAMGQSVEWRTPVSSSLNAEDLL
jgi:hypothetical protein